jgi:D-proline reductase (dithiol) PrdB
VGLVARVIEASGIPTSLVSTGRDLTSQVLPPRSLFVNFPMGNHFGAPGAVEQQTAILRRALELPYELTEGGTIVDWHEEWPESFASKVEKSLLAM